MERSGLGPGEEQQRLPEGDLLDPSLAGDAGGAMDRRDEPAGIGGVGVAAVSGGLPPQPRDGEDDSLLRAEDGAATGDGREG